MVGGGVRLPTLRHIKSNKMKNQDKTYLAILILLSAILLTLSGNSSPECW